MNTRMSHKSNKEKEKIRDEILVLYKELETLSYGGVYWNGRNRSSKKRDRCEELIKKIRILANRLKSEMTDCIEL